MYHCMPQKLRPRSRSDLDNKLEMAENRRRAKLVCNVLSKNSQDFVKIEGFYRPSRTRPILTQGIQICSQKWSQVNISIGYGYISQVTILYRVKFSKLEICQSDCRFKILGKKLSKESIFLFLKF